MYFLVSFCNILILLIHDSSSDSWAQGYRMLGAYVDCDARKEEGHSHDNNNNNNGAGEINCSRWMMWAAVSYF
jgi:hypothetical protein